MKTDYLEKIAIHLPGAPAGFNHRLASMLETLGEARSRDLELIGPDRNYHPLLAVDFQSARSAVSVDFLLSDGRIIPINVENTTGTEKKSPHSYKHLEIDVVARRLAAAGMKILSVCFRKPYPIRRTGISGSISRTRTRSTSAL